MRRKGKRPAKRYRSKMIRLVQNGHILVKHRMAEGIGVVVSDPSHRKRTQPKRDILIQEINEMLNDKENYKMAHQITV